MAEPGGDNGVGHDAGRSFGGDAGDELESPDDHREPERQLAELAGQPVRYISGTILSPDVRFLHPLLRDFCAVERF